ncbi:MAG TPA: 3-hydroxyacyl-ACP dehydratase FabZ [Blastocatellia bacterium]|nr:3-hydroxyacyl-ACP dehydratase FabZ [Blastocatellia bacterium]
MTSILNVTDIQRLIPHRFPFLLVDRVIEIVPRKKIVAIKNVTINEPFFAGHFPGNPVMPGVLLIEALAQTGGLLVAYDRVIEPDEYLLFATIDNVKFRRPVVPGDQLVLTVEARRIRKGSAHITGVATVDGEVAASGDLLCLLVQMPQASDVADQWRNGTLVPPEAAE